LFHLPRVQLGDLFRECSQVLVLFRDLDAEQVLGLADERGYESMRELGAFANEDLK